MEYSESLLLLPRKMLCSLPLRRISPSQLFAGLCCETVLWNWHKWNIGKLITYLFSWASHLRTAAIRGLISWTNIKCLQLTEFQTYIMGNTIMLNLLWLLHTNSNNNKYKPVGFQDSFCWLFPNILTPMLSCPAPNTPSACSAAAGRTMSAIAHLNSHCSNKSKCLWQKCLKTKTDANLFVFLRPKYPCKAE